MTHSISYRRILTRMGYYDYQNGLIYRHLNEENGWNSHLEHCREFIIRAIDFYKPEKITVFGSGWLLELPLAELTEKTGKIYLVDIIHPPDVINQTADLQNVELMELDVTGGLIEEVWNKTRKYSVFSKKHLTGKISIPEFKPDFEPGMVISLNILTQLESLLLNFLKRRSNISEDESILFRTEIQKNHIDFLRKHRSVLISDVAEVTIDKSGNITTIPTLITCLPSSRFYEEWTWDFDRTGSDFYNTRSTYKVIAITI
jgi:hypothetical protein